MRDAAAWALGSFPTKDERVTQALSGALQDSDYLVRSSAASSLRRVGVGEVRVAHALLKLLQDPNGHVRELVVEGFYFVEVADEQVIRALLAVLAKKVSKVSPGFEGPYGSREEVAKRAVSTLGLLKIKDPKLPRQVIIALCRFRATPYWDSPSGVYWISHLLEGRPIPDAP